MYRKTALLLFVPFLVLKASAAPWDGGSGYSGNSNSANGGSVTGGGGIQLIKAFSHNGQDAGYSGTGTSRGGAGGNGADGKKGSGGGEAASGAAGSAQGGDAQTDPQLTLLTLDSDNAGSGGVSQSGDALGGKAGNI